TSHLPYTPLFRSARRGEPRELEVEVTMELLNKRVLVVGLGKSGLAAARLLADEGARVVLNDVREAAAIDGLEALASSIGAEVVLGEHPAELFTAVDAIVLSPGVPPLPSLEAAARAGVSILSEIELASRFVHGRIAAVTGT